MKTINSIKISTSLFIILAASMFNSSFASENSIQEAERTYIRIGVDGMACPFCAYGLEKAIKKLDGVEDFSVELNEGFITFSVPSNKKPSELELEKLVKEAGFKIREFQYSSSSFIAEQDEKKE